jgi:hypothetical protein
MTPPVFFPWGMLMGEVFKQKPGTTNDLKRKLSDSSVAISPAKLSGTLVNTELYGSLRFEAEGN